jgi:ELWxxDGT repeat protein
VFFQASELVHEDGYDWLRSLGLWKTDGSAAGTVQVSPWFGYYSSPMPVGSALFFAAARAFGYYGEPDTELFRSDGTRPGTGLVKNINRFTSEGNLHHACYDAPSDPGPGIELGGRLLFAADDGLHGRELWESTGTRAGTSMLRDIDPRRLDESPPDACDSRRSHTGLGSDPRSFIRFANGALFTATEGEAGRELWWTDGTEVGTRRVADLRPGAQGSEPHDLVLFRGRVWFVASSEGKGEELWRTDGTRRGTVRIRRLDVAALPAQAWSLTAVGSQLFFVLSTEAAGPELWVSGGTAASTHRVLDVRPGPEGSYPQSLTEAHGLLVFAAADGTHGLEAWRSDGTAAGTFLLGDVNPGLDASAPGPFTPIAGGLVLSGADDGEHGRELWAYRPTG